MTNKEEIKRLIEEKIRPSVMLHDGDIELVELNEEEGVVTVRLLGACAGCPMAILTSTGFVEKTIKEHFPDIKTVKTVR